MEISAVCHVHSEWSYDASWRIEALRARFQRAGYRVLMMTEHDKGFSDERLAEFRAACARNSTSEFLIVPGLEYSDSANQIHVLVWGEVPFLGENLPTSEMLLKVKAHGGVAVWAHPSRRKAWESFEPSWGDALLGIEVWNRKYDGWAPSNTAGPLLERTGAVPFVGLDFHTARQTFPLAMMMDVGPIVCEESVLECMRKRRLLPHAFGMSLDRRMFRKALPMLGVAERARKSAASLARNAKRRIAKTGK